MSLYGIHKTLYMLQNDVQFRERVRTQPEAALADLPLTDSERLALLTNDVAALYRMGAHTFLMSRLPRFNAFGGLTREQYQQRLSVVLDEPPRQSAWQSTSTRSPGAAEVVHTTTRHQVHQGAADHNHGPDCGHTPVDHAGQHMDYLVDGHAHHAHEGHWDECTPAG